MFLKNEQFQIKNVNKFRLMGYKKCIETGMIKQYYWN